MFAPLEIQLSYGFGKKTENEKETKREIVCPCLCVKSCYFVHRPPYDVWVGVGDCVCVCVVVWVFLDLIQPLICYPTK